MTQVHNPESTDTPQSADPTTDRGNGVPSLFGSQPGAQLETPVPHSAFQIWMHRLSVLLFVLISAVAGVLLLILPWTPNWTDNYLLLSYPDLRPIISNGFFRGICSGLGLLDIWIGFWEALHYHEQQ